MPEKREQATTQFKLIAKAYEVLSNPSSKNQYDHSFNSAGPFHSSPFSYDDNYARTRSTASSPDDRSQFFGSSPQGPFSFTWESAADSARRAKQNARSANTNRAGFGFNNPFELFEDMFRNEMNGMGMGSGFGFGSGATGNGRSMFEDPFMSNHSKMSEMGMRMGGMPSMNNGFTNRGGRGSMMEDLQSNFESPQTSTSTSNSFFGSPSSFSAMPPAHGRRQQQSGEMTSSFSSSSHSSGGGPIYSSSSTSTSTSTYGFGVNSSSESRQTRIVNGRQETIIKKVDEQVSL